jgi:carboxylesterase
MDPAKTAPFELGQGDDACVLVHGFTGSPWDVRPLGEHLAELGFFVRGLRLPGHGATPESMLGVTSHDWLGAVEQAVLELGQRRPVFLCGLSMGALLSAIVAAQHPERVRGLVLLAPALRFRGKTRLQVWAVNRLPLFTAYRPWVFKTATDLEDPRALREAPILRAYPTVRLLDLGAIQQRCRAELGQVRAPSLIAWSEQDHVVDPEAVREVRRGLCAAREVRLFRLSRGYHILPRDFGRQELFSAVATPLERWRAGPKEPRAASGE